MRREGRGLGGLIMIVEAASSPGGVIYTRTNAGLNVSLAIPPYVS